VPVLRTMSTRAFNVLGPGDDAVAFLAGLGEVQGVESWIHGRRGKRFPLGSLMDNMFADRESGVRVLVARIYPVEGGGGPATLYAADPPSAERLRAWSVSACERALGGEAVEPPGRLFPGFSGSLAAAAPTRLIRFRDALKPAEDAGHDPVLIVLDDAVDSRRQSVEAPVELREETVFETNRVRRAGPLFTIVEEEIIRPVGSTTVVDAGRLEHQLMANRIPPPAARALADLVRRGASGAFASTNRVGATDYELAFDRDQSRVKVVYHD
jgi:hypothetical protein